VGDGLNYFFSFTFFKLQSLINDNEFQISVVDCDSCC